MWNIQLDNMGKQQEKYSFIRNYYPNCLESWIPSTIHHGYDNDFFR